MLFGRRINRAFGRLRESKALRTKDEKENVKLSDQMEKGDFLAMIISAFIVILPIALVVLLVMAGIAVLFFVR